MARIELKNCDVLFQDGLGGTGKIDGSPTPPVATDTTLKVKDVALNTADADKIPVGARLRVAGETAPVDHVVTARTPADAGPTTEVTISPALGAGTYADDGALTFKPQHLDIKVGDGNITYTEHREYEYMLDRGNLDTVRESKEVPMDVKLECVYEHITSGTGEAISPMEALKGKGKASEWVSASEDPCEPYAIDIIVLHNPPCGTAENERTTFPDFRADSKEVNFKDATISVSGKCNAIEPIVERDVT